MDHKNHEGYADPTAAEALKNTAAGEKAWRPCVLICSPFTGDILHNTEAVRRYMRFAVCRGVIPFAPHLLYPQVLDDDNPEERTLGMFFGLVWLGKCHELWVFGNQISAGMGKEITAAKKRCMTIRYFTKDCKEVLE